MDWHTGLYVIDRDASRIFWRCLWAQIDVTQYRPSHEQHFETPELSLDRFRWANTDAPLPTYCLSDTWADHPLVYEYGPGYKVRVDPALPDPTRRQLLKWIAGGLWHGGADSIWGLWKSSGPIPSIFSKPRAGAMPTTASPKARHGPRSESSSAMPPPETFSRWWPACTTKCSRPQGPIRTARPERRHPRPSQGRRYGHSESHVGRQFSPPLLHPRPYALGTRAAGTTLILDGTSCGDTAGARIADGGTLITFRNIESRNWDFPDSLKAPRAAMGINIWIVSRMTTAWTFRTTASTPRSAPACCTRAGKPTTILDSATTFITRPRRVARSGASRRITMGWRRQPVTAS